MTISCNAVITIALQFVNCIPSQNDSSRIPNKCNVTYSYSIKAKHVT